MTLAIYNQYPLVASSGCIRLLDIEGVPNGSNGDAPIRCALRVFDLNRDEPFLALSYVWGSKSQPAKTVLVGTSTLEVTDNCYQALRKVRNTGDGSPLWIDAICIDQDNETEQGQQIALMGAIYTKAEKVLIWLGEGTAATDRAIAWLRKRSYLESVVVKARSENTVLGHGAVIATCWHAYSQRWKQLSARLLRVRRRRDEVLQPLDAFEDDISVGMLATLYDDLHDLLMREWINRVWTYQEAMLATNPIIMCGGLQVSWSQMAPKILKLDWIFHSYNIRSVKQTALALDTWKKLIMSRDQLQSQRRSTVTASGLQPKTDLDAIDLVEYQQYCLRVARVWRMARFLRYVVFAICMATFFAVLGLFIDGKVQYHNMARRYGIDRQQRTQLLNLPRVEAACIAQCTKERSKDCESHCNLEDFGWLLPLAYCAVGVMIFLAFNFYIGRSNTFPIVDTWQSSWQLWEDQMNDMVDALCTRKSRKPKDKAFGMGSILAELLTEDSLPANYSLAQERIYSTFTSKLLQATNSPQLLLAAAINHMTGSPAWVSDWSGSFPAYWMKPRMRFQRSTNATLGSEFEWRRSLHDNDCIVVRGRTVCTIDTCFHFQQTGDEYQESENEQHIHNLDTMLRPFDSRFAFDAIRYFHPEMRDLICNQDNHPTLSRTVTELHLDAYYAFLRRNFSLPREDLLRLLQSSKFMKFRRNPTFAGAFSLRTRVSYQDILKTHIAITNSLHLTGRKLFATKDMVRICTDEYHRLNPQTCKSRKMLVRDSNILSNTSGQPMAWGICTNDVQTNDKVVLIAGLAIPLVVREEVTAVKLQSPALVLGIMESQAWPCKVLDNSDARLEDIVIC